nr:PepSY-associated TM helix domain-containing protein [uncultured Cohaesibacter sp.]
MLTKKKSNQSLFRRGLFWTHLAVGVATAIVIFILALSGALLTYEAQIKSAFDPSVAPSVDHAEMLSADELVAVARPVFAGRTTTLDIYSDSSKPVAVKAGRHDFKLLNPYTGQFIAAEANPSAGFFKVTEDLHRNLAAGFKSIGADIVKAANLAFLFLVVSGIYLWLPKKWKWPFFKQRILFTKMPTSKARDFNWHHVFSFWMVIPLIAVIGSGVVLSYGWANKLVFQTAGLEVPMGRGKGRGMWAKSSGGPLSDKAETELVSYQAIYEKARQVRTDWNSLSIIIPSNPRAKNVDILIDRGNGKQVALQQQITYSRETGDVVKEQGPKELASPTQTLRRYIRFLHTGEIYGIVGQTLAGIASLASLFLVWTGLALAWRRLISPLFIKKAKPKAPAASS